MEFDKYTIEHIMKAVHHCANGGGCIGCPYEFDDGCGSIEELLHYIKKLTEHNAQILSFGEEYEALARKFETENIRLANENDILRKQLEPFKNKQCFTCSFYSVGSDHMPCYACRDYDKYKWLGEERNNE